MSLIKNTLRQITTEGKIVIRVGPEEYERFFSSGAATIDLDSGVTVSATVIKDLSMEEGDLIVDSDEGTINGGINSQLEYVKIAFERANEYEPD
jgi:flagellar biosynthesis/type III secretory pathway protein FliH